MVKKADRISRAIVRAACTEQYEREEAVIQSFLDECRASMPPNDWDRHFDEARRGAGETFHIVEHLVSVLAATQMPILPRLRRSIDAMLVSLRIERNSCSWDELRQLNYDNYWKNYYGYA